MTKKNILTKREKVIEEMVVNGGNISQAVKDAGYSEAYARSGKITKTKALQELIAEKFPPEVLAAHYGDLLNKKEMVSFRGNIIVGDQPHSDVTRTLDMINKLQGNYAPERIQVLDRYEGLSDDELQERKAELDRILKRDDT